MTDATSENGDRGAASEEPVQADHVGALLCATRMRLGGDLQEIAKFLRIRYGYLVAIEDGRFEDLPGVAYSVGFVRAYADYLELDGSEVVRRLREENAGTVKLRRYEFPAPSGESGLPNGGLMVVAICLGMVVYGTWYTMSNADRDAVDLIQEVPARLAVLIDGEALDSLASLAPLAPPDMSQEDGQQFDRVTERPAPTIEDAPEQANPERSGVDMGSAVSSAPVGSSQEEITQAMNAEEDLEGSSELSAELQVAAVSEPVTQSEIQEDIAPSAETQDLAKEANETSDVEDTATSTEEARGEIEDSQTGVAPDSEGLASQDVIEEPVIETASSTTEEIVEDIAVAVLDVATPELPATARPDDPDPSIAGQVSDESNPEASSDPEAQNVTEQTEVDPVEIAEVSTPDVTESEVRSSVSNEDAGLVIELRAKSDSWIQVRDGDDLLLTRLLREGEVYKVSDREGLTLMTGNAGGLEVFVDGEQMPPLGAVGVVRRGVPLSAERLRSGIEPG